MARPILRLATRFTRRTRMTAWAIAFACMVLVGTLSLADGLANGIGSVADRIGSGPAVYIRGNELLASQIDSEALATIPGSFVALRAHPGDLEINLQAFSVIVVGIVEYRDGAATIPFPVGPRDVSLDVGLRARIEGQSGLPTGNLGNLTVFGLRLTDLPIVTSPPARSLLFPDDWAYVRSDLLSAMDPVQGGSAQAILSEGSLDASILRDLGLSRLETVGAVGFVRGGVAQVQTSFRFLAVIVAIVIGLLVYAAMSLEVHQRAREIATLRSLGAGPALVAAVYELQAVLLALAGALLGAALGIVVAHAIVSFAPLIGLPNLVILPLPVSPVSLAFLVALMAAALAGIVPSRRAAVLIRTKGAVPS